MIPVSLTLKGLYSYQDEQTIDFSRLIEGQLFGIFGSVGSGKSSILEAISFALYGQTERLDNRDNRNYNMMNLKSNALLIDFTFKNFDGDLYRYTVKGKRHGKDFEKVNTFDRAAYKSTGGSWLPLESTIAEDVIGLSYDNFRRTIIIPQGKFQEFLQLGHSHRTLMLKEIFQLDKFEFFNQTRSVELKNNNIIQHLNGQISAYSEIQSERIDEKRIELKELAGVILLKKKELEGESKAVAELAVLKNIFEELNAQKEIVLNLRKHEGSFIELESKIKDHEYCIIHFKNGLDRLKEIKASVLQKEKSLNDSQHLQVKVKEEIDSLIPALQVATEEFLKQENYKEKLQDYHHLISLVTLSANKYKLQSRIEKGEKVVDEVLTKKTAIENNLISLKKEIQQKNGLMPNMKELIDVRTWFDKKESHEEVFKNAVLEYDHLKNEINNLQNELSTLLIDYEFSNELDTFEELLQELLNIKSKKAEGLKELKEKVEHFKVQLKLSEFTDALKRGEACPLCGSMEHELVLEIEDVQTHLNSAQMKYQEFESDIAVFQKLENNIVHHESKVSYINKQLLNAQKKVEEYKERIDKHNYTFIWSDFDINSREEVLEKINQANLLESNIKELNTHSDQSQQELDVLDKEHKRYVESLDLLKREFDAIVTESSTLIRQLKRLDAADFTNLEEDVLRKLYNDLASKISIDKKRYEDLNNSLAKLKEQELTVSVQIESIGTALKIEKENLTTIQAQLEEKLGNSPFENWIHVNDILNENFDLEKNKKDLHEYNLQVYSASERLHELYVQAENKDFDESKYNEHVEKANSLSDEITTLNDQYVSEKTLLDDWIIKLAAKNKFLKELEQLEHRSENIKTMRQLFMANNFVNYISTVYLQNLCHVANERFYQLTRQQLRLELGDKNEFLVRDFMNNGKLRSVKTLSGGQTFQASLSLALALAESVQQQNQSKQNFFFLDEGFGSLDKESLQMAFETLKSLRKENRIVGIISHVEELQQEIDVYLNIVNDSFSGSKVIKSWEN